MPQPLDPSCLKSIYDIALNLQAKMDALKVKMDTEHKAQLDRIKEDHKTEKDTLERLHKDKCDQYELKLEEQERKITNLQDNLESKKTENTNLQNKLNSKNTENSNLRKSLNSQNTQISTIKHNLETTKSQYEDLKRILDDKKRENSNLEQRINQKNQEITNLQNRLNDKDNQIRRIENNLSDKQNEIRRIENNLRDKQNEIRRIETEQSNLKTKLNTICVKYDTSNLKIVITWSQMTKDQERYATETTKTAFNVEVNLFNANYYICDKMMKKYGGNWCCDIVKSAAPFATTFSSDDMKNFIQFKIGIYFVLIYKVGPEHFSFHWIESRDALK